MNNDLISHEALKEHKFVGNKFVQIGGRTNGKTLESINKAYQQGWNDAIDAIINNAPAVELDEGVIQEVLNKRCMTVITNEYLIELLYGKRPQGKWIKNEHTFWTCSHCNWFNEMNRIKYNFCPCCGADMRKEDKK